MVDPIPEWLAAYAQAYENLNQNTLQSDLSPLLCEQIYFEDPFNRIHGKTDTLSLFEHMFATLQAPKFTVLDMAVGQNGTGYLYWRFDFRYRHRTQQFDGMSKVAFDTDGRVRSHIDYWDPAKHVYSQIPILRSLLRFAEQRLALPQKCKTRA
ncbi:nuclear transport factor 2 family protein [Thiomicrorhabdus xiamenensis]|uniref:Nuclear transport factor 2 family protein n=1 Tax=Thiomicrorhabdus xiamenensis TaxID=2739063 RepID=A0A7D4SZU7_9GAMM|nr:nuclear transport factor 2 family protein [Thiomicrorhabdus xiamenensis]QKI88485.1 nuclear transport factor 2 family protein [Thiomicrorhabdus xiamenensis]